MKHSSTSQFSISSSFRAQSAVYGGLLLRALAFTCLILAMAGPRWPDLKTRIVTEGIAIGMVVDTSASMAEKDFNWLGEPISRLEALKKVFRLFVEGEKQNNAEQFTGRATDLISLVTFGTRPDSVCPLTLSHSVLLELLDELEPLTTPGESETNISDALVLGLHQLQSAGNRRKVLILLTDGAHNVPEPQSGWSPRQVAALAKSLGVPIYTIDAGGLLSSLETHNEESPEQAQQKAEAVLKEVSSNTGGTYFKANDTNGLMNIYQMIDQKERASIESFQYRKYHEGYFLFTLSSLMIWCLIGVLEATYWRRSP